MQIQLVCVLPAGIATRSYLYVEDVAEAFACVLHKGVVGEVYNIGTQKERTVLDVASDIAEHFKLSKEKIVHVRDRAFNDRYALHRLRLPCHRLLCKGC